MLDTAIKAVRLASKIFEDSFGNVKDIMVKEGKEFFTDIDLACEKVIIDTIRGKFPDHNIWSEECGSLEKSDSAISGCLFIMVSKPNSSSFRFFQVTLLFLLLRS